MVWTRARATVAAAAVAACATLPCCVGDDGVVGSSKCRICPAAGWEIRADVIPAASSLIRDGDRPQSLFAEREWVRTVDSAAASVGLDGGGDDGLTCGQWQTFADSLLPPSNSSDCVDLRGRLTRPCCSGLPPVYECNRAVMEHLGIGTSFLETISPIIDGSSVNVSVLVRVDDIEIDNHGVDGGTIRVLGALELAWTDPRLAWVDSSAQSDAPPQVQPAAQSNSSSDTMLGCASIQIHANDIWVPAIRFESDKSVLVARKVTLMADGRVFWKRRGILEAECETLPSKAKLCVLHFFDPNTGDHVKYIADKATYSTTQFILASEYRLNHDLSTITSSATLSSAELGAETTLSLRIHFDPIQNQCNICGYTPETTLINDTIPFFSPQWKYQFPLTMGYTCFQINSFLANFSVAEDVCDKGRANFEEQCCDDSASSFECESNIHDLLADELNTITPPDPSSSENDINFRNKDSVDVFVGIDVLHLVNVDIRSNTMELLIALELSWYDDRLAWDPFIGGCHHATFRASLDVELTEIWVPEVELINHVDGINTLPEVHASVFYNGFVQWRRTGVLKASCDLTGVERFPFDHTGCYLEFGGTRDPRYHRIHYVNDDVEYSRRVVSPAGFQEYRMDVDRTNVTISTEKLSGFANDVIRFQFVFTRAHNYYVTAFILLYIFFSYLSFGMFFVDYKMGERLGYGTSILFVIVAQDITLAETTPVTDELLWIYKLSFGSKIFVIFGIIESIVVLYLYSYDDFDDDDHAGQSGREDEEEMRPFIDEEAKCEESARQVNSSASTGKIDSCNSKCGVSITSQQDRGCAPERSPTLNNGSAIEGVDQTSTRSYFEEGCEQEENGNEKEGNVVMSTTSKFAERMRDVMRVILRLDFFQIRRRDSKVTKRMKTLRRVDWVVALLSFSVYTLFLIIMFEVIL